MQIIRRVDLIFIPVNAGIILLAGSALFLITGKLIFLFLILVAEFIYLYLALKKSARRWFSARRKTAQQERDFLKFYFPLYQTWDAGARLRFERDVRMLSGELSIRGIRGQPVRSQTRLLIAGGVALMLQGHPAWEPPLKDDIVVYPGDRFDSSYRIGRGKLAGQAPYHGPLIVTEANLRHSFEHAHDGFNVLFHELAHYFDLEDGSADGIPSARLQTAELERWQQVIGSEWRSARSGRTVLDAYAGTNEAELFAVAVESFFETPRLLQQNHVVLYRLLSDFFNLDPAALINY